MSIILAMHMITHLLTGGFIASWVLMGKEISLKEKIIILGMTSLLGILPDLLGTRDISPWSHSIVVMGLVMVPVVYLLRVFLKRHTYAQLYICFAGSVLGHILVDSLGHGVHLVYPLSKQAYTLPLIYLGDPTLWVPMLVGVILSLLPMVSERIRRFHTLLAVCIVGYLGLKLAMLVQIEQTVPHKFKLTPAAVVQVYPLGDYLVEGITDFWKMGFDVIDSQRTIRGIVTVLGGDMVLHGNGFFGREGKIVVSNTGKDGLKQAYRVPPSDREAYYEVIEEKNVGSAIILIVRDQEGVSRQYIYREGRWEEEAK
ncbi:metal-dependent hydrolase [Paenibacillus tritici]|uniref:metal-dependent hydrolase n=1 Tax=Paenibacillus tritici TaxID=1873425 RepID=UPI001BAC4CE1|nr:metal-dependent hydrolase [Paenibacillus tritici]QUL54342.1 metal-dependent hydrolase [Paenibacillus tritici]